MIRILLAHNEPTVRRHLGRMLSAAGHVVVAVDCGTQALPLLDERFDLLLADIVLPEMDGIELAQRCGEVSRATRILFISGFSAVPLGRANGAQEAGSTGTPFHLRRLVGEVEALFRPALGVGVAAAGASRLQAGEQAAKGTPLSGPPG